MPSFNVTGPVTLTQFANKAAEILREVRVNGRTVPISSRGEVVAVIRPTTHKAAALEIDLDDPDMTVSAREIEQFGPSDVVKTAWNGSVRALTFQNKPFALVGPATASEWLDEVLADAPSAGEHVPDDAWAQMHGASAPTQAHTVSPRLRRA